MRRLILITNLFPYGSDTGEMYLHNEIGYLSTAFDKIDILACDAYFGQKLTVKSLPENVKVYPLQKQVPSRKQYILSSIKYFLSRKPEHLKREWEKKSSLKQRVFQSYFIAKVEDRLDKIKKIYAPDISETDDVLLYSYRLFDLAYIAIKMAELIKNAKNKIVVSRAHRYDLYEEKNVLHYLPFRDYLMNNLDLVFPCSSDGTEYIRKKYGIPPSKVKCAYLGSKNFGYDFAPPQKENFVKVISCSNVVPVKRVELIAQTMLLLSQKYEVKWTHIGGGKLLEKLKEKYSEQINSGMFTFPGALSHDSVIENYKQNHYDIFINLSASEGIPQAIMEAESFGIPVIASDVGGNREIVANMKSGTLVSANADPNSIAQEIELYMQRDDVEKVNLRENTRKFWNENFNVDNNAQIFIDELRTLLL